MSNKYPCSARSAVEEHIIEDRLANVSVESREWVLDDVMTSRRIRYNVMGMRPLTSNIKMSDPE